MRCSPKLCIGLLLVGVGGVVLFATTGNAKASYLLTLLPFLACPLMCVGMMMFGKSCHNEKCEQKKETEPTSHPPHAQQ